jgi:hypothetical protein
MSDWLTPAEPYIPNHEQQMDAKAWLKEHDVDGAMVPVQSKLRRNKTDEWWLLEVFDLRDGKRYLDPATGEAAKKTISFPDLGIEPPAWFVESE